MKGHIDEKTGTRLRELRDSKGWSARQMAEELNKYVGKRVTLTDPSGNGNEAGRQHISKWERARDLLQTDVAIAYAKIFGVSLDYIYGLTDDKSSETKSVKDVIGLDDNTVYAMQRFVNYIDYDGETERERDEKSKAQIEKHLNYALSQPKFWAEFCWRLDKIVKLRRGEYACSETDTVKEPFKLEQQAVLVEKMLLMHRFQLFLDTAITDALLLGFDVKQD